MIVTYQSPEGTYFAIVDGLHLGPIDQSDWWALTQVDGTVALGAMTAEFDAHVTSAVDDAATPR